MLKTWHVLIDSGSNYGALRVCERVSVCVRELLEQQNTLVVVALWQPFRPHHLLAKWALFAIVIACIALCSSRRTYGVSSGCL